MLKTRLALAALIPALTIAPIVGLARYLWCVLFSPQRAWQIAIGFDQLVNAAANGNVDETISSRAHRAMLGGKRWGCLLCRFLDRFDKNHCIKSAGV